MAKQNNPAMPESMPTVAMPRVCDLGCGPCKKPGAFGIDSHPFPEVDLVHNLDAGPVPLPDNCLSEIYCNHVIEHVTDPVATMAEIHRLCRSGSQVHINTPHFSCLDSWTDMTHKRHLSSQWPIPFLQGGYLAAQTGAFLLISVEVTFPRSVFSYIPRIMVALFGLRRWEKYYAFRYPAGEVKTILQVIK